MITPAQLYTTEDVSRHYNELDHFYQNIWGEHLHHGLWKEGSESIEDAVKRLSHRVAEAAGISAVAGGAKVCDIGCGYGATSELLANEYGASVTGLTVSENQFAVANKRQPFQGSVSFRVQDWLKNSLPEQSFDAAIAIESSEHMLDKQAFANEAFRVLRPGGRIATCAWCASPSASTWQERSLLAPICEEGRLPGMATPDEYYIWLKRSGFHDIVIEDLTPSASPTWTRSLRRTISYFAKNPLDLRYLSPKTLSSSDFAKSLVRIALAYRTGAMVYALISAQRPLNS